MKILNKFSNLRLHRKLVLVVLVSSLAPLMAVSFFSAYEARLALQKQAFDHLESLREVKKHQIQDYFGQIHNQIITFSEQHSVVEAMNSFRSSYDSLPEELGVMPETLVSYRKEIETNYQDIFAREHQAHSGRSIATQDLVPDAAASIVAQYLYIAANPNALGSKERLDNAGDGSSYSNTHAKYHPLFRNFLQKFGYYDLFLVDPVTGDIVYSVSKEIDYTTSLLSGPHSNTNLGRAFRAARILDDGDEVVLVDFEHYVPSYDAAASFVASPIYQESTLVGVLMFQMPTGRINNIMQESSGLGASGETFLIGGDLRMRSQSRFAAADSILAVSVETDAAKATVRGETGTSIAEGYGGISVLSSFTPLEIRGLDWAILAEIDESEALAPVSRLMTVTMTLVLCGAALGVLFATFLARNVLRQLGADPADLLQVVEEISGDSTNPDPGEQTSGVLMRTIVELKRLAMAVNHISDGVLITDTQHRIQYVNPGFTRITGYGAREAIGQVPRELVGGNEYDRVLYGDKRAAMRAGKIWSGAATWTKKDGSQFEAEQVVSPVRDSSAMDVSNFISIVRDVTERKSLERQLNQAQKLESIGQLAAGIAHEINTPSQYIGDNTRFLKEAYVDLAGLIGKLGAFAANEETSIPKASIQEALEAADVAYLQEEIPRAIEQTLEGVGRVTKIVRAMKEFSHPAQERTDLNLNRAIESTIVVASNEWKYIAELETDLDPALPVVSCFPGEFNQVILNMIVNASHAIAEAVDSQSGAKGKISVRTRKQGDFVEIGISDTGNGMPDDVRARIFDPFFTTKDVGKGTGQGLSMAYNVVVEKHGGTIEVESEIGKGTRFLIRLPIDGAATKE